MKREIRNRKKDESEKEPMADETDVLDEQVRPSCYLSQPRKRARARANTWIQDETNDIRNRRAYVVRRTIQDGGVEIRTDASDTRQHVCERKRPKANVSVPTKDADDGHPRNARRLRCASKPRRRRRCRPCRSCDPTTCGTKR